jgi:GNAT superfamily N-acetyltransferase
MGEDADAIASLLSELGYPTSVQEARLRLSRLGLTGEDGGVLIAEVDNETVALASYQFIEQLHRAQPQCRITTLVVRADQRRRGVARMLIAAIESLAREAGCYRLEVTTQPQRVEALPFYVALGFHERPSRLVKTLADD